MGKNGVIKIGIAFAIMAAVIILSALQAFASIENVGSQAEAVFVDNPSLLSEGKMAVRCTGCESGSVESEEVDGAVRSFSLICHDDVCAVCTTDISQAKDECGGKDGSELDNCIVDVVNRMCTQPTSRFYGLSHATAEFYISGENKGKLKELNVLSDAKQRKFKPYNQVVEGESIKLYPSDKIVLKKGSVYEVQINTDVGPLSEGEESNENGAREDRKLTIAGEEFDAVTKGTKIAFEAGNNSRIKYYELNIKSVFPKRWHVFHCGRNKEVHLRHGARGVKCKISTDKTPEKSELLCPHCDSMDLRIFSILSQNEGILPPSSLKLYFPKWSGFKKAVMSDDELKIESDAVSVGPDPENGKGQSIIRIPNKKFEVKGNQIIIESLKDKNPGFLATPIYSHPGHGAVFSLFRLLAPEGRETYSFIVKTGAEGEKSGKGNIAPIPVDTGKNKDYVVEIWAKDRGKIIPDKREGWQRIKNYDIALIHATLSTLFNQGKDHGGYFVIRPVGFKGEKGGVSSAGSEQVNVDESAILVASRGKNCSSADDCGNGEDCVEGQCLATGRDEGDIMCDSDSDCQPGETCVDGSCGCGSSRELCDLDEQCIRGKCESLTLWSLVRKECFNGLSYSDMTDAEQELACNIYLETLRYNRNTVTNGYVYAQDMNKLSREQLKRKYCSGNHFAEEETGYNYKFAIEQGQYAGVKLPGTITLAPRGSRNLGKFTWVKSGFCRPTALKWKDKVHPARDLNTPGKKYFITRNDFKELPNGNLNFVVKTGQSLTEIVKAYNSFFGPKRSVGFVAKYNGIKKHPSKKWYILHPGESIEFPKPETDNLERFKKLLRDLKTDVYLDFEGKPDEVESAVENAEALKRLRDKDAEELPVAPLAGICNKGKIWAFDKQQCVEGCREDSDCTDGKACFEGKCQIPPLVEVKNKSESGSRVECRKDSDCRMPGNICVNNVCKAPQPL